jgi:hypothetical protein
MHLLHDMHKIGRYKADRISQTACFNSSTDGRIFMTFYMNVMPLEAIQTRTFQFQQLVIITWQMHEQMKCEALAPLNKGSWNNVR